MKFAFTAAASEEQLAEKKKMEQEEETQMDEDEQIESASVASVGSDDEGTINNIIGLVGHS